ncbi:MAG: hypothetical protein WC515_06140 [Candidatus Omnitrophota bacterium]
MRMPKNRFVRIVIALLVIYVAWSVYINLINLCSRVDDDALVPCLIYLPPLGFFALGLIALKVLESAIVIRLIRKIFRKNKKPG